MFVPVVNCFFVFTDGSTLYRVLVAVREPADRPIVVTGIN